MERRNLKDMKMPDIDKLDRIVEQKLTDPIQVKHLMLLLEGRMKQRRRGTKTTMDVILGSAVGNKMRTIRFRTSLMN